MEPTINVGDVVFTVETKNINKQDIISFKVNNVVVTHRVIDIIVNDNNETRYITKGDANSSQDIGTVKVEDIEGKYLFKIGQVGNIILFLKSEIGTIIIICVLIISLLFVGYKKQTGKRMKEKNDKR